jgi:hypothetical protein
LPCADRGRDPRGDAHGSVSDMAVGARLLAKKQAIVSKLVAID